MKVFVFGVFLVRIVLHSDWIRREYLSVFSSNTGKSDQEISEYGHFSVSAIQENPQKSNGISPSTNLAILEIILRKDKASLGTKWKIECDELINESNKKTNELIKKQISLTVVIRFKEMICWRLARLRLTIVFQMLNFK